VAMPEPGRKAAPVRGVGTTSELRNVERETILKALEEARGIVAGPNGAAARLGLKRTTLQSRMRKYNISRQFQ